MSRSEKREHRILEIILVVIAVAITYLLYRTSGYKMVVLNLFYLPVILSGFFLGRYRAGVLALLCVVLATVVTAFDVVNFASYSSPIVVALAIMIWGAVIGLTALLVGTLSDERTEKIEELHEAYVGVVEVLAHYLQSANPRLKAKSSRVAELCQEMASQMKFSSKEIDDVRVAALLHDLGHIEITSRVIEKAVGNMETDQERSQQHTFHGTDLVHSLGSVLSGALPLLLDQVDNFDLESSQLADGDPQDAKGPRGSEIIRAVRTYVALREGDWGQPGASSEEAIEDLWSEAHGHFDPAVIDALENAVAATGEVVPEELGLGV